MAVVWRGYDSKLHREVAIKEPVIAHGTDPQVAEEVRARFIREGRTAAQLSHPGIATVFGADIHESRPVIVMELIEGETLSELLKRGPLPTGAAVGIAEQLLGALAYAHERGVVHRDIKPDNVFVTDDGRVKVADFGIAHVGQGTQLTQAGTVMGTPGYMAPEQIKGEAVDARADIFSVGVMLHEMLAGTNPFCEDDAHPTTIMHRVLNEPLPDVRGGAPNVSEGIAATIAVATAMDTAERFSSATAMRRALLGEVAVAMPKVVSRKGKPSSTLRNVAIVGVALVVVGLLFWVVGSGAVQRGEAVLDSTSTAGSSGHDVSETATGDAGERPSDTDAVSELSCIFAVADDGVWVMDPDGSDPRMVAGVAGELAAGETQGEVLLGVNGLDDDFNARIILLSYSRQAEQAWEHPDSDYWWVRLAVLPADGLGVLEDYPHQVVQLAGSETLDTPVQLPLPTMMEGGWRRAAWSPDGALLLLLEDAHDSGALHLANPDGTGLKRVELSTEYGVWGLKHVAWAPDSQTFLGVSMDWNEFDPPEQIIEFDRQGRALGEIFGSDGPGIDGADYSPDGQSIVFSMDGRVYVMPVAGGTPVDVGEGRDPVWVAVGSN